jgi:hypothetical protein
MATEAKAPPATPPATAPAAATTTAAQPAAEPAKAVESTNAATPQAAPAVAPTTSAATSAPAAQPAAAEPVPPQPSARATMHKMKRKSTKKTEPAVQAKPDRASPNTVPSSTQHAEDAPKASAAPRETVIVEHIAPPDTGAGTPHTSP